MAAKKRPAEPKLKKQIPFAFVLEEIAGRAPFVRAMFGAHAVYVGDAIVLILRHKEDDYHEDNGVWIATTPEHHESLRKEFPSMRDLRLFGTSPTSWQCLPEKGANFEAEALHACALINRRDPRIGKVPKPRKRKAAPKKKKAGPGRR